MTYNLQAVAAMDDPEHATGKTLKQHETKPPPGGVLLEKDNGTPRASTVQ